MIKKYDDNYIDLSKVDVVTKIYIDRSRPAGLTVFYCFDVGLTNKMTLVLKDDDKERLSALRERLVKDWMEVKDARD